MKIEKRAFLGLAALSLVLAAVLGFVVGQATSSDTQPLAVVTIDRVGVGQAKALDNLKQDHEALAAERDALSHQRDALQDQIAALKAETMLLKSETSDQAETIADLNARLALEVDGEADEAEAAEPAAQEGAASEISPEPDNPDPVETAADATPAPETVPVAELEAPQLTQNDEVKVADAAPETETLTAGSVVALSNEDVGKALDDGLTAYKSRQFKEAFETWQPLAELGVARAQFYLGGLYRDGAGVKRDMVQAYVWLKRSEDAGYRYAGDLAQSVERDLTAEQLATAQDLLAQKDQ